MSNRRRTSRRYGSLGLVACLVAIAVPETAFEESCSISATPPGPVQPGAKADVLAGCTGGPSLIQWTSSLASCAPVAGPSTVCAFPSIGTAVLTAQATYSDSFGGSFSVSDSYQMGVSSGAMPSCYVTAFPPGPVQPGATADVFAGCTDGPSLIQWSSSLASCAPVTGLSTVCTFPTVGTAVLTARATYSDSFGGSFSVSDSYQMGVSSSAMPSCYVTAVPPGPVQAGATANLFAGCTDGPSLIQWSSSLASCAPTTGPATVCTFPSVGTAVLTARATYSDSFGGSFSVSDSYLMGVSPPIRGCHITAIPPGPVQPGATAGVSAGCTGEPVLIQWTSSLASCAPSTGPSTACTFPTVGTAVLTARAIYSDTFGGSFSVSDSYLMGVSSGAAPSCFITATPPGPVRAGATANLLAGCTDGPSMIQWTSSLASCTPPIGPSTDCTFPSVGTAVLTVRATYSDSFGGSFSISDSYAMNVESALAGAARSWVASTGDDANPCTVTSPCRSFGRAIAATAEGGEVVALDSAGYGPVTITQPVSIISPPGVYAGVSVATGTGIIVNVPSSGRVILRGLTISSLGGATGIDFQSGAALFIERTSISNFVSAGLSVRPGTGASVYLRDAKVRHNGTGAVFGPTPAATGVLKVEVDRVSFEGNAVGLSFEGKNTNGIVRNSDVRGGSTGLSVQPTVNGGRSLVDVRNSTFSNNTAFGVQTGGGGIGASAAVTLVGVQLMGNAAAILANPGGALYVSNSSVNKNTIGIGLNGGTVTSLGDNRLMDNLVNGTFSSTIGKR